MADTGSTTTPVKAAAAAGGADMTTPAPPSPPSTGLRRLPSASRIVALAPLDAATNDRPAVASVPSPRVLPGAVHTEAVVPVALPEPAVGGGVAASASVAAAAAAAAAAPENPWLLGGESTCYDLHETETLPFAVTELKLLVGALLLVYCGGGVTTSGVLSFIPPTPRPPAPPPNMQCRTWTAACRS